MAAWYVDNQIMQRCLELASKAIGKTSPNPLVGAVVVKDGVIVGEGFHPAVGEPHAEVFALRSAGDRARGATIYVNLEPCNHYGRTPPCTEALIAAGVAKVVVGTIDPDSRVSGTGIERLKNAGIEVVVGVEEEACNKLNEAFFHRVVHQRPFGILKYAMTLDGKIATTTGHSAWVSSEKSRNYVHHLRAASDVVIVGGNTVRRDNPHLTTHGVANHNPLRVVMSRSLNLPIEANLWDTDIAPTLVLTEQKINPALELQLLKKNVEIIELKPLNPSSVMQLLYERGKNTVLWECGGNLAAGAIASGAVQKILAFIAPKIVGGNNAPSPIGDLGIEYMTEALLLDKVTFETIESDLLLQAYLK